MQQKNFGRPTNPDPDIGWGGHGTGRKGGIALAPIVAKAAASRLRRKSQLVNRLGRYGEAWPWASGGTEPPGFWPRKSPLASTCSRSMQRRGVRPARRDRLPRGVTGVRPLVRELRRRTFWARPRFADRLCMSAHGWAGFRPQNAHIRQCPICYNSNEYGIPRPQNARY